MSEVFLCATGQLTGRAKSDLRKAGIVVVEVDDPSACQFIRSTETVPADDMVWAALDALAHGTSASGARDRYVGNLAEVLALRRATQ